MNLHKNALLYFVVIFVTCAAAATNNAKQENTTTAIEDNALVEFLIQKLLIPKLQASFNKSQNGSSQLIADVNNLIGSNILTKNGDKIQISYENLLNFVKLQGNNILGNIIGKNDILLNILARRKLNDILENYFSKFEGAIKNASFPSSIQTRKLELASSRSIITTLFGALFTSLKAQFLSPVLTLVNQTLINLSSLALNVYQPIVPTDFFPSIIVTLLNNVILRVVDFIDTLRTDVITALSATNEISTKAFFRTSLSTEVGTESTRSIIDVILTPFTFLASIILTPLRNILQSAATYLFVTLRPVIGGIILAPIESLILAIIKLIPCSSC